MNLLTFIIFIIFVYLFGSIPFGLLYSILRGVDIRKVGSGNIGATNVSRQFGFIGGFVPVFILDFLKGAIPILLVKIFGVNFIDKDLAMIIAGICAGLGHIFPIYLKFKGGKGVATFAGVFSFIAPLETLLTILVFLIVLFSSRFIQYIANKEYRNLDNPFKVYFSGLQKNVWISSIIAAIVLPIIVYLTEFHRQYLIVLSVLVAIIIIYSHRKNIKEALKNNNTH
ncbi:MAG: glycerol-3-phosphate acyltransferase [Brevinematales bacterium]|nr:glycerol-3-phosphate acyltransferase [Brevinematales bacterium]